MELAEVESNYIDLKKKKIFPQILTLGVEYHLELAALEESLEQDLWQAVGLLDRHVRRQLVLGLQVIRSCSCC